MIEIFVGTEKEAEALTGHHDPHLPAAVRFGEIPGIGRAVFSDDPTHVMFAAEHGGFFGHFPRLQVYPILR